MRSTVAEGAIFTDFTPSVAPKTCPKCGYPVSDDSTSCPNCNHELQQAPTMIQTVKCKSCGTEIASDVKFCPSCGNPTSEDVHKPRRIQRSAMGTVMGGPVSGPDASNKFCTLRPIAWEGEEVNYNPITYSGDTIILNRSNTDANNNSITSREQAILTCEEGEWYIENRSDLRTTFIRVNGKIKLNSGDIIVLGNREFEFKG
ncbi:zinc-ribbon domain-containing protein [Bacteroides intestinalis]|nr:zinc-ribbon domain-containing protein [Bacteroides intestinalis]